MLKRMKYVSILLCSLFVVVCSLSLTPRADGLINYSQNNDTHIGLNVQGRLNVPIINPFTPNDNSNIGDNGAAGENNDQTALDYVPKELTFQSLRDPNFADSPLTADGTSVSKDGNQNNFVFAQVHDFGETGPMALKATLRPDQNGNGFTNDQGGALPGAFIKLSNTQLFQYNIGDVIYNNISSPASPDNIGTTTITTDADAPVMLSNTDNGPADQSSTPVGSFWVYELAWTLDNMRLEVPFDSNSFTGQAKMPSQNTEYNGTIDWNYSPQVNN
ncbi:WxL domain-containing protein [Fructilactobacillus fructivorans]|uniref:WxL domain-containing protein n=1 Tax=Fructilactobacillus fructivorans TaxID=1614 RepID=UPI0007055584|nr:WxL domain-containing protein [Fructilactobacillus fructivorans]